MDIRPYVIYKPSATSSRGKNDDIIAFAQFEEDYLKLVKMRKAMTKVVTNPMTIQLCHHYLA